MNRGARLTCCAVCNKNTEKRCRRCQNIFYCSKEHQREDWKRHKSTCEPMVTNQGPKSDRSADNSLQSQETAKRVQDVISKASNESWQHRKNNASNAYQKRLNKSGSTDNICKHELPVTENVKQSVCTDKVPGNNDGSIISSVVYTNKDLRKESAITYEGSSEKEILSETAQQLSSVEFATNSSLVLRTNNKTEGKMPVMPLESTSHRKEYPEALLKSSAASFSNAYQIDPSDPFYELCQRVIRDMTQYGVCVLNNFLGRERGLLVLKEVLEMYRTGIFQAGQLVSNASGKETQTIRSDRITWIDGREPHCYHISRLISQVDNIILRANKMANNGKMGDYIINGRTKAMVACYPGHGSHYVKHVDNPNKDGRCITAIYYLNVDWDVNRCGGLLRVFPEGTNQVADIAPIFDRMLFFWSDRRNPHEVQPAFKTRYAITLWYFDSPERAEARRHFKNEDSDPSTSK